MKSGLGEIVGRRISSVVVAANSNDMPHHQVFLMFDDGTYFEFWGELFSCGGGVDRGGKDDAIKYALAHNGTTISAVYPADAHS